MNRPHTIQCPCGKGRIEDYVPDTLALDKVRCRGCGRPGTDFRPPKYQRLASGATAVRIDLCPPCTRKLRGWVGHHTTIPLAELCATCRGQYEAAAHARTTN